MMKDKRQKGVDTYRLKKKRLSEEVKDEIDRRDAPSNCRNALLGRSTISLQSGGKAHVRLFFSTSTVTIGILTTLVRFDIIQVELNDTPAPIQRRAIGSCSKGRGKAIREP
jgi:hypothetical protein